MWRTCGLVLLAEVQSVKQEVTPVAKVTELLTKLTVQVQEQGKREAAQYDKYACFCKEQSDSKSYSIAKSDDRIASLEASIESLSGEITVLDEDVTGKKSDLETEKTEAEKAQKSRSGAVSDYAKESGELKEAISAVDRALREMKTTKKGVVDDSFLATVQGKLGQLGLSTSLLQGLEDPASYKFKSDDVIAVLQELSRTFKLELKRVDEEEATNKHSFNMVEGARSNKMKAFENEVDKKESLSAEKGATKSEQQGSMDEEQNARGADQAFLEELSSSCENKATLWDQRSKTRAAELTALTEAKELLSKAGENYGTNTKLVDLQEASRSFLQTRSSHASNQVKHLLKFLESRAGLLKSSAIKELVAKLVVGDDHFVRVRQLINDLIARLKDDATSEATQKSFCDEEMKKSVEKRDENNNKMEDASANIDKTESQIVQLNAKITVLGSEIAESHKALNEMTQLRNGEKAQNEKTISESAEGAEMVRQAIGILNKFYAGGGFLQEEPTDRSGATVGDLAPETFEGEYAGSVDSSKGIIGMMEVIASDFDRTNAKTTQDETTAQADFELEETRVKDEIAAKKGEKEGFESDVKTKDSDLTEFKGDLKDAKTMHAQSLDELETLKPACVEGEESYAQRKAEREKEIEALKEALRLLEEWQG